jgi:oxalate decarboxylase/phosphoglucose isomerase-like protein (cupin superfamily)
MRKVISISKTFEQVKCLEGRTPETTDVEFQGAFAKLSEYRDGGVFLSHYSGYSEWERHPNGDELVQVIDGETTLILLSDNVEAAHTLKKGELLVVPQNMWHRFETPKGVKVLTITPQPTEHSIEWPQNS